MSFCIICRPTNTYFKKYNSSGLYNTQVTELHSNDAGYTHLTSGLSRSLKKLVDGLFRLNRVQYLSKGLNLLVKLKNIHKDYNQQNDTHPCVYGVAVRGYNGAPLVAFKDTLGIRRTYSRLEPRRSHAGSILRECL